MPYLDKLELSSSRSNVDIAFIKQLNIFDNAKINRLVDADKKKLTDTFNKCYRDRDFKKFAQLINDFAPESTGAGIVAFSSAYHEIVTQNRSEEQIRKLEEDVNKGNENFSYKRLVDSLDKGLITRIIDRIYSNNTLKRVNSAKGTGLSGLQFAQLLTGAYYIGDVYSNSEKSFENLREIESLLFQGNKKVVANKKLLHSLGFDDKLFENEEGEYTRALNNISEDIEKNVATSGFFKDRRSVQLEDYSLQEILDLNKDLKVLKSALSIDFVKSYLGLSVSDNFKDLNKLNPTQRKQLQVLLKTSKDEKLNTRIDTLQKFADVIDKSVDNYCVLYREGLKEDLTKEQIKTSFIEALAENGAFASKDLEEFSHVALFTSAKIEQEFLTNDYYYNIINENKVNDNFMTVMNVLYNGKYYYLDDFNFTEFYKVYDEKHPEPDGRKSTDELLESSRQLRAEMLVHIRHLLEEKYNCNFNNLTQEDVVDKFPILTASVMKVLNNKTKEKVNNKQNIKSNKQNVINNNTKEKDNYRQNINSHKQSDRNLIEYYEMSFDQNQESHNNYYFIQNYSYDLFEDKMVKKYPNGITFEQLQKELGKDISLDLNDKYVRGNFNLTITDLAPYNKEMLGKLATIFSNINEKAQLRNAGREQNNDKFSEETDNSIPRDNVDETSFINAKSKQNDREVIFTSSQIYREAYEEAYSKFMSHLPINYKAHQSKEDEAPEGRGHEEETNRRPGQEKPEPGQEKPDGEEEKTQPDKEQPEPEQEKPEGEEEKPQPEKEVHEDTNNKDVINQFISNIENIKIVSIKGIQELNISNEEKENYVNRINTLCLDATNTVKNENNSNFADLFVQVGNNCNKILIEAKDISKNRQANVQFQQNIEKIKKEVEDLKVHSISSLESNISDSEICKKYVSQTENLCNDFIKNIEELSIKGTVVKSYTELAKKCLAVYSLAVRESKQKSKADLHEEEVFKGGEFDEKHFTTHQYEAGREELEERVVRREQSSQVYSLTELKRQKIAEARQIQGYNTFNSPLSVIFADYPDEITEQQVQEIENKCNEYFEQLKAKNEEQSKKPLETPKEEIDIVKSAKVSFEGNENIGLDKNGNYYILYKNGKVRKQLSTRDKNFKAIKKAFESEVEGQER